MDGEFDDNWLDYELRTNGFCEMVNQVFLKQKFNQIKLFLGKIMRC